MDRPEEREGKQKEGSRRQGHYDSLIHAENQQAADEARKGNHKRAQEAQLASEQDTLGYAHLFEVNRPLQQPRQAPLPDKVEAEPSETTLLMPAVDEDFEMRIKNAEKETSDSRPNVFQFYLGKMLAAWDIWKYLIFRAGFSLVSLTWFIAAVYEYANFNTRTEEIAFQSAADGEALLYYVFTVTVLNTPNSWINTAAFLFSSPFRLFSSQRLDPSIIASGRTCELPADFAMPFSAWVKIIAENIGTMRLNPDPFSSCPSSAVAYDIVRDPTPLDRADINLSLPGYEEDNFALRVLAAFVWIVAPIALLLFLNNPRQADNQLRFFNALFWIIGAALMLPFEGTGLVLSALFFCACFWAPDFRQTVYDKLEWMGNGIRYLSANLWGANLKNRALAQGKPGVPQKIAGKFTPSSTAMREVLSNTSCVTSDGIKHQVGKSIAEQLKAETRALNDQAKKGMTYETDVFGVTIATSRINAINALGSKILASLNSFFAETVYNHRSVKFADCTRDKLTLDLMDEHRRLDKHYHDRYADRQIIQDQFIAAHQTLKKTTALLHTDRLPQIIKHHIEHMIKHSNNTAYSMLTLLDHCPVFFSILIEEGVDQALKRLKSETSDHWYMPNHFKRHLSDVRTYYMENYDTQHPNAREDLRYLYNHYHDIYGPLTTQQLPHRRAAADARSIHTYEFVSEEIRTDFFAGEASSRIAVNALYGQEAGIPAQYDEVLPGQLSAEYFHVAPDEGGFTNPMYASNWGQITWQSAHTAEEEEDYLDIAPDSIQAKVLEFNITQVMITNAEPEIKAIAKIAETEQFVTETEYTTESSDVEIVPAQYDPGSIHPLLHNLTKTPIKQNKTVDRNFISAIAVATNIDETTLRQRIGASSITLREQYQQAGLSDTVNPILQGIAAGDQSCDNATLRTICAYFLRPLILIGQKEKPVVIGDDLYPNKTAIFLQKHPFTFIPERRVEHFDALNVKEGVDSVAFTRDVLQAIANKEDLTLDPQPLTRPQQKWRITLKAKERDNLPKIKVNITLPPQPQTKAQITMPQKHGFFGARQHANGGVTFAHPGAVPPFDFLFYDATMAQTLAKFSKGNCSNTTYSSDYVTEIHAAVKQANQPDKDSLDKIHHDFVQHYANNKGNQSYSTNEPATQKELHILGARLAYTLSGELAAAKQQLDLKQRHQDALDILDRYIKIASKYGVEAQFEREFTPENLRKLYLLLLDPDVDGEARKNTMHAFHRLCASEKYQQDLGCRPETSVYFNAC